LQTLAVSDSVIAGLG